MLLSEKGLDGLALDAGFWAENAKKREPNRFCFQVSQGHSLPGLRFGE
jgi:hypothetical protein